NACVLDASRVRSQAKAWRMVLVFPCRGGMLTTALTSSRVLRSTSSMMALTGFVSWWPWALRKDARSVGGLVEGLAAVRTRAACRRVASIFRSIGSATQHLPRYGDFGEGTERFRDGGKVVAGVDEVSHAVDACGEGV